MDGQGRSKVAGRHRGGRHRPGRVVPARTVSRSRPRPAGGRSLPRGAHRQPLLGQGAPTSPKRDLGHRGRKADPLYRIRKLLLSADERLDEAGHHRMLLGLRAGIRRRGAGGMAGQGVGEGRLSRRRPAGGGAVVGQDHRRMRAGPRRRDRLPRDRWHSEILAYHDTGASNGPTEGLNLCVKKVKRCGHGFRTFEHYRLRVLLHAGGVTWPSRP